MRPRLIGAVQVTVERLDQEGTAWDEDFREPVADTAVTYKPAEAITAQTHFTSFDRRQMVPGGDSPSSAGYVLYERDVTPSLHKGDKITAVGGIQLQNPVFVNAVEPAVQHGGRFYMELAQLQERAKGL